MATKKEMATKPTKKLTGELSEKELKKAAMKKRNSLCDPKELKSE